jgi:hypothetical protein
MSALYWLPAGLEREAVRMDYYGEGHYDFRRHFIGLGELLAAPLWTDTGAAFPQFRFSMGSAHFALGMLGAVYARAIWSNVHDDSGITGCVGDDSSYALFSVSYAISGLGSAGSGTPMWNGFVVDSVGDMEMGGKGCACNCDWRTAVVFDAPHLSAAVAAFRADFYI